MVDDFARNIPALQVDRFKYVAPPRAAPTPRAILQACLPTGRLTPFRSGGFAEENASSKLAYALQERANFSKPRPSPFCFFVKIAKSTNLYKIAVSPDT
jgi:hypothetical protein